jgi:hypothetical protein
MNRTDVRRISQEAERVLKEHFGDKMSVTYKGGSFGVSATLKFDFAEVSETGEVLSQEADDFRKMAAWFGLKATDLGRKFRWHDGKRYEIMGMKPRSRKYPILARRVDSLDKCMKFTADSVKMALELE